jgi:multiple sugar transport system ATP-binding protein
VRRDGVVEQHGTPLDLYDRPANTFVATFIGSPAMNLLEGAVHGGAVQVFVDYALPIPAGVAADSRMTVGLRPDHLSVHPAEVAGGFPAQVTSFEATGAETMLFVTKEGRPLTVVTKDRLALNPGATVWLRPDLAHAHFFAADGKRAAGN